ncbi:MAG: TIGR00703 family protein [Chloroflexi bacterium]|nr:TIGR00703 family protein [Chloroflexota bacterium]
MAKRKLAPDQLLRKHEIALHTYVREQWEEIPRQIEVKLKSLKAWGFDLIFGLRGGEAAVFVSETERGRKVGEVYEEEGETFEIREIVKELPKGARIVVEVGLEDRRGVIHGYYRAPNDQETLLFTLPAAELLLAYFKKRRLHALIEAFHSSGLTTEFIRQRGTTGKPVPFENLPPKMRQALRVGRDVIRQHTHAGRFTLVYFGKNKDGDDRYVVTWLLPTIYLFDVDIAEKVDKSLAALG